MAAGLFGYRVGTIHEVHTVADESTSGVAEPTEQTVLKERPAQDKKPKRQPKYNVILWDDQEHTVDYVVAMMRKLFGHPIEKGIQIAMQVDGQGRAIVLTTTKEHAELKRDQIHAFGKDDLIAGCKGSMSASIEPLPE
ncbi:MAG: ATP-dependent Clp protease adaptor ClpS [Planctomycetota bacterium]|nr:MAG: ATP-dependent Clp protease adaptor ClpS [Planctomycetota bacterium]